MILDVELALTDGQRGAALVDGGAHAFGKRLDEIGETNFADGVLDGVAVDTRSSEADVGFDGAREKKRILQNNSKVAA